MMSGSVAASIGWIVVLPPLLLGAGWLGMAAGQRQRGRPWSAWRSVAFLSGAALIAVALLPPVMERAHHDLRWHMVQHLAIGMFAPLGLVLAAPLTLLLRSVPVGAGRAIAALLRTRPVHALSHPATALVLNIGGMYALYLTPLFAWSLRHPAVHGLVLVHFLGAGALFTWAVAGPDVAPRRPGIAARTVVLVVSLGLHAALGKLMYAHLLPSGTSYPAGQLRESAMLMYYGGDIAELLLAVALFGGWYGQRQRRRLRAAGGLSPRAASASGTGATEYRPAPVSR